MAAAAAPAQHSSGGRAEPPAPQDARALHEAAAPRETSAPQEPDDSQEEETNDARFNPAQPDFTLVGLPTTLVVPRHKSAFRVTHRFTRPLGSGDFGELVSDFFGFDTGAQIGLEFRFGLVQGTQVGIHRTSDKTIEFFGLHEVVRQRDARGFGLAALASVEGGDNFQEQHAPALGAVLSHEFGSSGAVYLEPVVVWSTNLQPDGEPDYTALIGLGGRWRIRPTVYAVAELAPRLAGYDPDVFHISIGVEKRAGGHSFQLNVSNTIATTPAQIARGGLTNDDWFIGFNISRKFF
jgi:hypothetical protein